eukprot:2057595-Pyramimonas_sp.AAC.1
MPAISHRPPLRCSWRCVSCVAIGQRDPLLPLPASSRSRIDNPCCRFMLSRRSRSHPCRC